MSNQRNSKRKNKKRVALQKGDDSNFLEVNEPTKIWEVRPIKEACAFAVVLIGFALAWIILKIDPVAIGDIFATVLQAVIAVCS